MGIHVITESTVLDLHSLGIKETDMLYIFCIGGGGGGGGGGYGVASGLGGRPGKNATPDIPEVINNMAFLNNCAFGFGSGGQGGNSIYNDDKGIAGGGGAGGGAGNFAYKQILMCQYTGSWNIPVTIGKGGLGGAGGTSVGTSGSRGGNGGTTSFGSLVSASGGTGGPGGKGNGASGFASGVVGTLGFMSGAGTPSLGNARSPGYGGGGAGGFVLGSVLQFGDGQSTGCNNGGIYKTQSIFGGASESGQVNVRNTGSILNCIPGSGAVILFW